LSQLASRHVSLYYQAVKLIAAVTIDLSHGCKLSNQVPVAVSTQLKSLDSHPIFRSSLLFGCRLKGCIPFTHDLEVMTTNVTTEFDINLLSCDQRKLKLRFRLDYLLDQVKKF